MEHDHNHAGCCSEIESKIDIFFSVKSGILIAVQEIVSRYGESVLNSFDKEGNTPAHYACSDGSQLILEFIIDSGGWFNEPAQNEKGQRPIHLAAYEGHCVIVEILLNNGVSVDIQDSRGRTPLINSAQTGKCSLAAFFIAKGASKSYLDNEGDGPLHWAAYNGHAEMVRMLIYFGYDPEQPDRHFQRPIHLSSLKGNIEVVRDLCNIDKVDIKATDENGCTALSLALKKNNFKVSSFLKLVSRRNKALLLPTTFRSLTDGSFIAGSQNRLFVILSCFVLFFGYPTYIYEFFFTTWNELFLLHMWFIMLNVLFWISFIKTHTTHPGFLDRNDEKYAWTMHNISSYLEIDDATSALSRLCHSCRIVKPLRSKHCRICNRCVDVMDHHCYYVGNCIGNNNRNWFVMFVTASFLTGVVSITFCYHNYLSDQYDILVAISCTVMIGLTGLAAVVLICIIWTISSGLTTNERANWKRYNYLQDAKGRLLNPYNRGFLFNLLDYFHIVQKYKPVEKDSDILIV